LCSSTHCQVTATDRSGFPDPSTSLIVHPPSTPTLTPSSTVMTSTTSYHEAVGSRTVLEIRLDTTTPYSVNKSTIAPMKEHQYCASKHRPADEMVADPLHQSPAAAEVKPSLESKVSSRFEGECSNMGVIMRRRDTNAIAFLFSVSYIVALISNRSFTSRYEEIPQPFATQNLSPTFRYPTVTGFCPGK